MNGATHSPAPWGIGSIGANSVGIVSHPGPRGIGVAYGWNHDEAVANARLMVAAPAMLAALRAILETSSFDDYPNTPEHRALETARKLLKELS